MKKPVKKGRPGSTSVNVAISADMRADLQAIADRELRTLSNIVRLALSKFIVEDQARRKLKG